MTLTDPSLTARSAAPGASEASAPDPAPSPGPAPAPGSVPAAPNAAPVGPTHPCARCGAPVAEGIGLCERCNPLGLRDSAASQVHGTVFAVVAIAIVLLLVLARLSIAGSGPYPATVSDVRSTADGLALTVTVTNQGTDAGQTTCRIVDAADRGVSRSAFVLSPQIGPDQTVSFSAEVSEFGPGLRELAVTCRTP